MKVWCKKVSKITKKLDIEKTMIGFLVLATFLSGGILASVRVKAGTEVVDEVTVVIPVACSMSSTSSSNNVYTETVTADSYTPNIGDTRIKVFCNDFAGFSVYAVGFTNDTIGNNTMATSTTPAQTINTGTATSGNTSNWAMKLTKVTNTSGQQDITYGEDNLAITDGTTNYNGVYRTVPATYTKVATYTNNNGPATTDTILGSNIDARYAVFVSATQPAGTYEGKVKYMLVHPATMEAGTYTLAYNANGGTGTMESDTNLPNYQEHQIKANTFTAPTGYMFAGWCTVQDTTASGVVQGADPQTTCTGDSYADGATLPASPSTAATNGGTLTLYAYWRTLPTINDLSYMQDFAKLSSDEKTAVLNSMTAGIQHQLTDNRDNKIYYISKLADGRVWMTQNLDLNITAGSTALTSENTDISTDTSIYTENSTTSAYALKGSGDYGYVVSTDSNNVTTVTWVPESTTIASDNLSGTTWTNDTSNPYSYDKLDNGNPYYPPDNVVTEAAAGDHAQAGNYYNWTAAIASNDSSSLTSNTYNDIANNPKNSICPKGWRLPTIADNSGDNAYDQPGSTSEFGRLNQLYNGGLTNDAAGLIAAPLYFVRSGYVNSGSLGLAGDYGGYWSSTVSNSSGARALIFYATYVLPANNNNRGFGFSVRCVAK